MFNVSSRRTQRSGVFFLIAFCLLCVLAAEEWLSIRHLSLTDDEDAHIYAGYQHWKARDFGVNPEHPPVVKLVAAVPLLGMQLRQPHPPPINFIVEQYAGGAALLFANDAETILRRTRMAASLFTFVLAMLLFAAGYEMFGPVAALIALALFTFEPTVLAHGSLVTTDMGVACFTFAAVYTFYRFLKQPGLLRLLICGLAVGLALASKVSGVLVLPILLLLAIADVMAARENRGKRAITMAGALAALGLIGYIILWGFYTFRYAARTGGAVLTPSLATLLPLIPHPWEAGMLRLFASWHLLPEAYLFAWAKLYSGIMNNPAFLFGHIYPTGTWLYFPAAFVVKTSLTLLILLIASMFALQRFRREATVLWIAFATLLLACMTEHLNIGVRHALGLYPFAILLAAGAAWSIAERSRVAGYAVASLLIFQCAISLHAYPDYLPYGNEAFGGPSKTYKVLSDSNVDWGQQLKEVHAWMAEQNTTDCWMAYSNISSDPDYYQMPCKPLPTGLGLMAGTPQPVVPPHIRGIVLVDAVDASGVLWGPGDLNPYRQFQDGRPAGMIGNSILVYRGDFDVPLLAAQTHVSQVRVLLRSHQGDRALAEAQEAARLDPDSPAVEASLGGTLLQLNRKDEAQQAFSKAMQLAHAHQPDDESPEVTAQIAGIMHPPPL